MRTNIGSGLGATILCPALVGLAGIFNSGSKGVTHLCTLESWANAIIYNLWFHLFVIPLFVDCSMNSSAVAIGTN